LFAQSVGVMIVSRTSSYCDQCGLQFRMWTRKLEHQVCDQCNPKEFKELHEGNVRQHKKRFVGQQHITEHTFFPKHASGYTFGKPEKYRRTQQ